MKTNEIKILLQKFFDGKTTPVEETMLEDFFLDGDSHPGMEAEAMMFHELVNIRDEKIIVPENLEELVIQKLEPLQRQSGSSNRRLVYYLMSAAAALFLIVSTFLMLNRQDQVMAITDPQLAYAESKQALVTVSEMLNRGRASLAGLNKINAAVEPLQAFSSLDKATRELQVLSRLGDALKTTNRIAKDK